MRETIYTLSTWRVRPGKEAEFVAAWKELGRVFSQLPHRPTDRGTLVQSLEDPTLFHSFGPWHSVEDVEAMRASPRAQQGLHRLSELCEDSSSGTFRVVAESQ